VANERPLTRQERRERKLASKRERIPKHGAALAQLYANAILKRARQAGAKLHVSGSGTKHRR
jgi:hypothetical protein